MCTNTQLRPVVNDSWMCAMSLNAPRFSVIPEDTARVAKAAFPKGNRYLLLRDALGPCLSVWTFSTSSPMKDVPPKIRPGSPSSRCYSSPSGYRMSKRPMRYCCRQLGRYNN